MAGFPYAGVVGGAAIVVEDAGLVFQSLNVQSSPLERSRSPRSTGPRVGWKSRLMTGAVWARYRNRLSTPAFAPARS